MTKAELESKHLADLHALAAEAGVPRYRMLPRAELIEKLQGDAPAQRQSGGQQRPPRKRERRRRSEAPKREPRPEASEKKPEAARQPKPPQLLKERCSTASNRLLRRGPLGVQP